MKTLLKTIGIVSTLIGSSFLFQNCSEKESIPEGIIPPTDSVSSKIEIKNFSIEAQIHTSPDSTVTMQGEGFLQSDTVALISETAANNTSCLGYETECRHCHAEKYRLRYIPVMAQTGNRFLPIGKNDIDYRECRRLKHSRYCRHDSQRCSILRK